MPGMSTDGPPDLEMSRRILQHLAATDFPKRSPLYAAIAREAMDDGDILELTAGVPWHEIPPMRLLAAVRYLLLSSPGEPLAEFHADMTDRPRPPDDAYPVFRAFCTRRADELRRLVRERAVQTNEVSRCACYMPAVCAAQAELGAAALGLVDVGSSAGLGLHLDRYAYDFGAAGTLGTPDGGVTLACEVRGERAPALSALPAVGYRVGLDRSPIDVRDEDSVRWLQACVWPGQGNRVAQLSRAIEAARRDPPHLVAGDAVRDLPAVLDAVPEGLGVCVMTSVVLNYLGLQRDAFVAALEEAGRRRPLAWVLFDTTFNLDGTGTAPGWVRDAVADAGRDFALVRVSVLSHGGRRDRWLARCSYHGEWIEWME